MVGPRLEREVTVARWGHWGVPVLLFPTAGGDAEEIERMGVIDALHASPRARPDQGLFLRQRRRPGVDLPAASLELLLAVAGAVRWLRPPRAGAGYPHRQPHRPEIEIAAAGASIGAFNAVAALCRHPDVFTTAICLSGTYDLEKLLGFQADERFYFGSPLLFVPNLPDGPQLDRLRRRFVLLAFGEGRWESPEESWRMADVLGRKGIPNRVDPWGHEHDHDWPTWRWMLPHYLGQLPREGPPRERREECRERHLRRAGVSRQPAAVRPCPARDRRAGDGNRRAPLRLAGRRDEERASSATSRSARSRTKERSTRRSGACRGGNGSTASKRRSRRTFCPPPGCARPAPFPASRPARPISAATRWR